MRVIYRYRTAKPDDGHFHFQLHANANILAVVEHWYAERGWEIIMDVLEDTSEPKERRYFFLCNAGDKLDFLGEYPDIYYVGMHETRAYASYVFDTTHLSETERQQAVVSASRYTRGKPPIDEMSYAERQREDARRRRSQPPGPPTRRGAPPAPTVIEKAVEEARLAVVPPPSGEVAEG